MYFKKKETTKINSTSVLLILFDSLDIPNVQLFDSLEIPTVKLFDILVIPTAVIIAKEFPKPILKIKD